MTVKEWLNDNDLSLQIWENKYRHNQESFEEWLDRVSAGNQKIRELIKKKKFLFGGRTLSNRGTNQGTYSNCYCSGRVDDSLEDIMVVASNIAKTFKAQGGQGLSLTNIRPKGSKIGTDFISDGIVPFMEIFNTVTQSISQGNSRRGALMISLSASHPQIMDFISIKDDLNKINNANLSVEIDDDFMEAVGAYYNTGEEIILHIPNRFKGGNPDGYDICPIEIYRKIVEHAWRSGEPGVMFMGKFCNYNLMEFIPEYQIYTSNPCGEQPLPKAGSCNLSSINLAEYIEREKKCNVFKIIEFSQDVATIVEAMDDLIDENANNHSLEEQKETALRYRNVGIGVMGVHDTLMKLGYVYGSKEAQNFMDMVMSILFKEAIKASAELASKKGSFPAYNDNVWNSAIIRNHFSEQEISVLKSKGLRNCSLISIAPTGSIGTMLNVSTGCEPWFNLKYTRTTKSLNGGVESVYEVVAPIVKELTGKVDPKVFVTAQDINWVDRINMQAIIQKHCDTAISSTINLPKDTTLKNLENIYLYAWQKGLKGLTIFRDGCRDGILKNLGSEQTTENKKNLNCISPITRTDLGRSLIGTTSKNKTACGTLYVTINKDSEGNIVEIFTNSSKNGTCKANLNGETRMASLALRSGVKVEEVIDQLKGIHCQACVLAKAKGAELDGISCPDVIARCIREVYSSHLPKESVAPSEKCPECGNPIQHEGGCMTCPSCGWSKCN